MEKKDICKDSSCKESMKDSRSKKSSSVEFSKEISPSSKKQEKRK